MLQIGTGGTFDAEAYRQSLAEKQALQQQIKEKRHGSAAQEGESRVEHTARMRCSCVWDVTSAACHCSCTNLHPACKLLVPGSKAVTLQC